MLPELSCFILSCFVCTGLFTEPIGESSEASPLEEAESNTEVLPSVSAIWPSAVVHPAGIKTINTLTK